MPGRSTPWWRGSPTVRALADDLDHLESHIERYGSVTIQHPSVWGQARLTKHREEFEKVMQQELCGFHQTLQGALSRSDQAYFMNAMSLGVAVSGPQAVVTPTTTARALFQSPDEAEIAATPRVSAPARCLGLVGLEVRPNITLDTFRRQEVPLPRCQRTYYRAYGIATGASAHNGGLWPRCSWATTCI